MKCSICSKEAELRPYGPNRSMICFDCGMKPERFEETTKNFIQQLIECGPGPVVIGSESGPYPLNKENRQ